MNRQWPITLILAFGLPTALLLVLFNAVISPVGFGVGLLFFVTYLVAGVLLFRVGPLWPRAGVKYVLSCLAWGGGISMLLIIPAGEAFLGITDKLRWEVVEASWGGAYPEEIVKAFGVLIILYAFRELNRPWHGFVTGGLIGLGFEVVENMLYGSTGAVMDPNSDFDGVVMLWGVRLLYGPGMHIALTAVAGWGIGLALFQRKSLVGLWWVAFSLAVHFCWNIMWPTEKMWVTQSIILMVLLYAVFGWIYWRATRQQKLDNSYVLLM